MHLPRREYLKRMTLAAASGLLPAVVRPFSILAADPETRRVPSESEAAAIEDILRQTVDQCDVPGLSVAVGRHGQILYQRAVGKAGEEVIPSSRFRIASVSKPITSVAIFSLIEQGRLALTDWVFGEKGVLKFDYGKSYPERVTRLTLYHLLTHTSGGWGNIGKPLDPMFCKVALNHHELISWAVQERPLDEEPGSHYAYSNFGYCILGRVIEKVSGKSYAEYVKQAVLSRCGITDMRIGGNTLAERVPGEVVYYKQPSDDTEPYNPKVMNVTRMDSHGGWIATPSDLVRFAMQLDGFATTPGILSSDSIKTMTTASQANSGYACGWGVNRVPNWWHAGSLPGSATILVRTAGGLCWAALANSRPKDLNLDQMMWKIVRAVPGWRA